MSIKININKKQYEIPDRLTVEQYSKAIQFDWSDPKYYPMIVAQLTGAPVKQLMIAHTWVLPVPIPTGYYPNRALNFNLAQNKHQIFDFFIKKNFCGLDTI